MTEAIQGFSSTTFSRRREKVMGKLGNAALVLSSAPTLYRSRDTEHIYRPDSELFYLSGCIEPDVVAVLRGGTQGVPFVLFVPRRNPETEVWSGPRMGPDEAKERFGADAVYPMDELERRFPELLKSPKRVFFRLGKRPGLEPLVVQALHTARARGSRTGEGPRGIDDPGELLDELRLRKDPEEVDAIRRSAAVTVEAFREAMEGTRAGMGEWEVETLLEAGFRARGASCPAFPTVVGSGSNGCVLHYSENSRRLKKGELVLMDAGAEVGLYAGDVSRTIPVGGRFSPEQRSLYQLVLGAHRAALGAVKPGNTVGQVHEAALEFLVRGLQELDVLRGDGDELIRQKAYEPYFPHQTSHWLGLDVHDVGDYAVGGCSRVLEAGMVLTVEPGLYFSPRPDEPKGPFTGLGIRIEDDVLVTQDGSEILTSVLPVSPDEIEGMVGSG